MPYVTDTRSEHYVHKIKGWQKVDGTWRPLIYNNGKLVFPEDHILYKRGYKIINKLFEK